MALKYYETSELFCLDTQDFYLRPITLFAFKNTQELCMTYNLNRPSHILIEWKITIKEKPITSLTAFRAAVNKYYERAILKQILGFNSVLF